MNNHTTALTGENDQFLINFIEQKIIKQSYTVINSVAREAISSYGALWRGIEKQKAKELFTWWQFLKGYGMFF